MDSLEAFERGRNLPAEALNHSSPINPFEAEIIPLKLDGSISHIWQGFNRSAIFFLDQNIVLKAQKQYHVPSVSLPGDRILLDIGLANFEGTQLERQAFGLLQESPHPNLLRCLDTCGDDELQDSVEGLLFFERLAPLSTALPDADMSRRCRWVIELASAFSHLESLGLIPTKIFVGDLGVDKSGRLKLVGFGASPRRPHLGDQEQGKGAKNAQHAYVPSEEVVRQNMAKAHQRLASCLHYILSGVDPDEQAQEMSHAYHSQTDRKQWREAVRRGEFSIAAGAEPTTEILRDAWTVKMQANGETRSFSEVERRVQGALGALEIEDEVTFQPSDSNNYQLLEEKCRVWLRQQEREPRWMAIAEYEDAVRNAMAE